MASQTKDAAWMEWIEGLMGESRQTIAATLPPERYYCLLDELPLHLLPRRSFAALQQTRQTPFRINPDCILRSASEIPQELLQHSKLTAGFAPQGTIAWVRDRICGTLLPFWLGPRLETAVRAMQAGESGEQSLSNEDCCILSIAGILQGSDSRSDSQSPAELSCEMSSAKETFAAKHYVPLPNLIHPFHVAALRRYYRCLIRKGVIHQRDTQSPGRIVAHNEPVARFFHFQLAKLVSEIAGEPIKPSYVYFASYRSGAKLEKHIDREQCEVSISLCLDFAPEPEHETPWPLWLDTAEGPVAIHQALGDGLLYRGTKIPHYRDILGEGLTSTSIFFHYVPTDFSGPMD